MSIADQRLIIFLKAPRPGKVKTRLAKTLGEKAATDAYVRLVRALLKNLATLEEVELRFAPDEARAEIQPWLRKEWQARPQGGGDLGNRLVRAFAEAFADGASRVVIIGSDCPEITARDIREAWTQLRVHDLVLGPALDGGYWLIGLNKPRPKLFAGVAWSSEQVLQQTLEKARNLELRLHLMPILTDIDTEEEWRAFLSGNKTGC